MSISTQGGGSRRPSAKKAVAGAKPKVSADTDEKSTKPSLVKAEAEDETPESVESPDSTDSGTPKKRASASKSSAAARAAAKKTGARPATRGGGGGRRPITPVRVSQGRNWGPIALFAVVILVAVGIIGFAGWQVYEKGLSVGQRLERIDGVTNYLKKGGNADLKQGQHAWGPLTYPQNPPIGGKHNPNWQNCMADVYEQPIAKEHALHSMEHGAVWLTYDPAKLNKDQVAALAAKVKKFPDYIMMSPYEGMDRAVSLQAWGYQLKVDDPADKRIDEFIKIARKNAAVEPGAACDGGITETGTTPRDLGKDQQQQGG